MDTASKFDWGLIVGGIALFVAGVIIMAWPGITLYTLALIAGFMFIVAGIVQIANFIRNRHANTANGWALVSALCNLVLGAMFLFYPLAGATVITWVAGAFALAYGFVAIMAAFQVRKMGVAWGWITFDGIVAVLCGLAFVATPAMFAIFLGIFLMARGITLTVFGLSAPTVLRNSLFMR